jgi:hypothetical protein
VESEAVAWLWVVNGHRAVVPKDYADELIEDGETVLPLYTHPARDGQDSVAVVNKASTGEYEFYPSSNLVDIPNGMHKLYTHPASAEVERLQSRVAAQQSALNSICTCSWGAAEFFDVGKAASWMQKIAYDALDEVLSTEAFILRKQAEAVQASRQALSSCSEIPNSSGQASRQEGEPVGTAKRCGYDRDITYCELEADEVPIGTKLYTHPASADVPEKWRTVMKELADDLESEVEARRSGDLDRRIERDLIVVREARALLAEQEQDHE